ncbi:MAG: aldo/keto reductase, partial [Vallitaleaceae bacterium]|nr:aldo/keto reductase [Vallitaleaceae bacterium]
MNYRVNPKNGEQLSILGYGCMRFPTKGNSVDEKETEKQIISAIEQGVNYFDTAYIYHFGKSESVLGKILAKGYRDRVKIATKLPPYMVRTAADMDKIFYTQLERLQTDRVDYYLMHMLSDLETWNRLKSLGIENWIKDKKQKGQIINLGFSYHGGKSEFLGLINDYPWDFCQIQYNFLDENNQAGKSGLEYAASKGIPVIVMEPLRGGKIINHLPKEVNDIWEDAEPKRTPVDWALRWIWNHPEVTLLLSGMSTQEQIDENVKTASESEPNALTEAELNLFVRVKAILRSKIKVECTACGYCMPCPSGVDIPTCFSQYNEKYLIKGSSRMKYFQNTGAFSAKPSYASLCTQCGK